MSVINGKGILGLPKTKLCLAVDHLDSALEMIHYHLAYKKTTFWITIWFGKKYASKKC